MNDLEKCGIMRQQCTKEERIQLGTGNEATRDMKGWRRTIASTSQVEYVNI